VPVPAQPKIYHICHVDRLPSIVADGCLWCDAEIARRTPPGTSIGMNSIKQRRMNELTLTSHPGLHVGDCVPFYFCSRSVMLYLICQANHPDLSYRNGQGRSFTWNRICVRSWTGRIKRTGVGPSHFQTQGRVSLRIGRIWRNCGKLTGMPCTRGTGNNARKASRPSSW